MHDITWATRCQGGPLALTPLTLTPLTLTPLTLVAPRWRNFSWPKATCLLLNPHCCSPAQLQCTVVLTVSASACVACCCCLCWCYIRWELQLVAPGQQAALRGPRHQAILAAFEQYSTAVEDIAADAEAAAAAAAAVRAGAPSQVDSVSTADVAADSSAVPGCSLGQILRARFDHIMSAADTGTFAQGLRQDDGQLTEQQALQAAVGESVGVQEVAAWLASDATGLLKQSFAEGWGCRWGLWGLQVGFMSAGGLQVEVIDAPAMVLVAAAGRCKLVCCC